MCQYRYHHAWTEIELDLEVHKSWTNQILPRHILIFEMIQVCFFCIMLIDGSLSSLATQSAFKWSTGLVQQVNMSELKAKFPVANFLCKASSQLSFCKKVWCVLKKWDQWNNQDMGNFWMCRSSIYFITIVGFIRVSNEQIH